jgi:TonB family protein
MRLLTRTALLALFGSVLLASGPLTRAQQDQPEAKRKVVTRITPSYPSLARKMGISGSVKIEATVLPNGAVKSTETLGGHPVLAQAATDAVRNCKWEPASHETKELIVFNFHPD